jgi:hypothetical protein
VLEEGFEGQDDQALDEDCLLSRIQVLDKNLARRSKRCRAVQADGCVIGTYKRAY